MPAVNVTEHAIKLIDDYRSRTEWDLSKKEVATKAIKEFHDRHVETEENDGGS